MTTQKRIKSATLLVEKKPVKSHEEIKQIYETHKRLIETIKNKKQESLNILENRYNFCNEEIECRNESLKIEVDVIGEYLKKQCDLYAIKLKMLKKIEEFKKKQEAIEIKIIKMSNIGDFTEFRKCYNHEMANARKCMNCLCLSNITELKSFKHPSDTVKHITEAVCILLNYNKPSWQTFVKKSKEIKHRDNGLTHQILQFNIDNCSDDILVKLEQYIQMNHLNYDKAKRASKSAAKFYSWIIGISKYYKVYKKYEIYNKINNQIQ